MVGMMGGVSIKRWEEYDVTRWPLEYMLIKCLFAYFLIHESHFDSLLPLSCPLPKSILFACGALQK